MERDFMGLNSRVVKEEAPSEEDSGFGRGSGVPWLFSNKVSSFSSLRPNQDEKHSKNLVQYFPGKPAGVSSSSAGFSAAGKQWVKSKASDCPAQLTIFYGGAVTVFDDIFPEKAKEVMCLAGKYGAPLSSFDQPRLAAAKLVAGGDRSGNESPISVSSHTIEVTNSVASSEHDLIKREASKMASPAIVSTAVPHMRKASLARFLEKRKERVMSASPYVTNKKYGSALAQWVAPEAQPPRGKEV